MSIEDKILNYTLIEQPIKKEHYVIRLTATTCKQGISYPEISVYCTEEQLIEILPSLIAFLEDEDKDYFEYDFDPVNYIEFGKDIDYHADGNFVQMYKINSIHYHDGNGKLYKVTGVGNI